MAVLRPVFLAAVLLAALSAAAQNQNPCPAPPLLGPAPPGDLFNDQQEAWLGDAMAERIQRDFRVLDDPQLNAELERIGTRLLGQLPPTAVHYRYFVIDIPEINAFSIPGRVYVSRKLIAAAQNEDELAGIIAHELGHNLTHQIAMEMSGRFRAVLGVTAVGDRDDIYLKYHQYLENYARKPGRPSGEDRDQTIADQVAIYALARAGYAPGAYSDFWDRTARTQGKTGGWLSDLFGETRPEERRLRDMRKAIAALPAACVPSTTPQRGEAFLRWQAAVVEYSGPARQERLPGLVGQELLAPPLQAELSRLRFSPDGRYLLAQDEAGITILTKDPLGVLFHIDALDAQPAQFSPDSRSVQVYTNALRVESWDISSRARTSVRELAMGFGACNQTRLSPDGRWIACLTDPVPTYDLVVLNVDSGKEVFRKKEFYEPSLIELLNRVLAMIESDVETLDLIAMDFSPDSRYFLAGSSSRSLALLGDAVVSSSSAHTLGLELASGKETSLNGSVRNILPRSFTFFSDGRLAGVNPDNPRNSSVVRFPEGKKVAQFAVGYNQIEAATAGDYLLVRPVVDYPVGLFDLGQNKLVLSSRTVAMDCYNGMMATELRAGQVALRHLLDPPVAQAELPKPHFGRLRAAAASHDLRWLAVSGRDRGAIWDLQTMQRLYVVRAFNGAWFENDQLAHLDFPKFQKTERMISRLSLSAHEVSPGFEISETGRQFGRYLLLLVPPKKGGDLSHGLTLEAHDVRNDNLLWSRSLRELPGYSANAAGSSLTLLWPQGSSTFKDEVKNSPALKASAEKDDFLLQVLDFESGKQTAELLLKTGRRSLGIDDVRVDGGWALVRSDLNTYLLYSLAGGQVQARFFGAYGILSAAAGVASIENEPGQVTLYDLRSGAVRRRISLTSPLAFQRFSADGKRLLLVTRDQTVYFFDAAASADTQAAPAP